LMLTLSLVLVPSQPMVEMEVMVVVIPAEEAVEEELRYITPLIISLV